MALQQEQVVHVPKVMQHERAHHFHVEARGLKPFCFPCGSDDATAPMPAVATKRVLCEEIVDVPVEQHIEQIVHVPKVPTGPDPGFVGLKFRRP